MKSMESVRKITNRMELVQVLRAKLVKARLSLIAVTFLLVVSGAVNVSLYNKLTDSRELVAKQELELKATREEVVVLAEEKVALAGEIDRLNSFDTLISNVMKLDDICEEMTEKAIDVVEGVVTYTRNNRTRNTDIAYTDNVVSLEGQKVRTLEANNNVFVVYIDNKQAEDSLNKALGKEYYIGREDYIGAINSVDGVVMVKCYQEVN